MKKKTRRPRKVNRKPKRGPKRFTFNIKSKDNEYYPIEMAEHLRGAVYEGPANNANQVVSNLANHGKTFIKVVFKWNTGPELLKIADLCYKYSYKISIC